MSRPLQVLVTDYAWADVEEERAILKAAGASLVVAETGEEQELIRLAVAVDGILTCWKPVTAGVLNAAVHCRSVGRYGIGLDNIDVACATELGMVVTNVPAYCVDEVSDHAMALILACSRKVAFYDRMAKSGLYDLGSGTPLYRLAGKTLGIFGFGKIGRVLSRKASAFGMRILAHDPLLTPDQARQAEAPVVSFPDLLSQSDFVSIHAPLTEATRGLFSRETFRMMKPTAFLINTARGGIVDTRDLVEAIDNGLLAGAGLDVFPVEPPPPGEPALKHPRIVVTPHAAFNSVESLIDLRRIAAGQMAQILNGVQPESIVNPQVLRQPNLRARLLP